MADPVPHECPHCGANLTGTEIPSHAREHFGGHSHYSSAISVYDDSRDRTVAWRCPHCGGEWERHTRKPVRWSDVKRVIDERLKELGIEDAEVLSR